MSTLPSSAERAQGSEFLLTKWAAQISFPSVTLLKTPATFPRLPPTKFQSTLINLNISSHSGWLMLLFTLVKSCLNMYEAWKESSQLSVISQTCSSWTPAYCYDPALWSKPAFWTHSLRPSLPWPLSVPRSTLCGSTCVTSPLVPRHCLMTLPQLLRSGRRCS